MEDAHRADDGCGMEALAGKTARVPPMQAACAVRGGGDRGQDGGGLERAVSCGVRHHGPAGRAQRDSRSATNCAKCAPRRISASPARITRWRDTGTLVMMASPEEARLVSLLPPAHIAVVPRERILTGLDELFTILPHPADADQFDGADHGPEPHGGYRADPGPRRTRSGADYSGHRWVNRFFWPEWRAFPPNYALPIEGLLNSPGRLLRACRRNSVSSHLLVGLRAEIQRERSSRDGYTPERGGDCRADRQTPLGDPPHAGTRQTFW